MSGSMLDDITTTAYDDDMDDRSTTESSTSGFLNPQHIYVSTYVGAAVALFAVLLTLFSYIGYRKFWVKRTHINMFNLCVSLLLFFTGYILTNHQRHYPVESATLLCVTGAFICHLAILCAWFWTASYWVLILFLYRRPSRVHINHFFLKASFVCYLLPILISAVTIAVAAPKWGSIFTSGVTINNLTEYNNDRCFVDDIYMYIGFLLPFVIILLLMIAIFVTLLRGYSQSADSPKKPGTVPPMKRIKKHMIKISSITITVFLVALSTILVPNEEHNLSKKISGFCFTIGSLVLGLVFLILLHRHREEIKTHWVAIFRGKSKIVQQRSLSLAKTNSFSKLSSKSTVISRLKKEDNNFQPLEDADFAVMERKTSLRIVPKDDTDMSTLGLIQIPGTPAIQHEDKIDEEEEGVGANIRDPNIGKSMENLMNEDEKKTQNATDSNHNNTTNDSKTSNNTGKSLPEATGPASPTPLTKTKSHDIAAQQGGVEKRINQKNPKRRSFSSSSFKPFMGKQLNFRKRQSVLSTDSTQMTSFE